MTTKTATKIPRWVPPTYRITGVEVASLAKIHNDFTAAGYSIVSVRKLEKSFRGWEVLAYQQATVESLKHFAYDPYATNPISPK